MRTPPTRLRQATPADVDPLLTLWGLLFEEGTGPAWSGHATEWFLGAVDDGTVARFPVIEADGGIVVATAIGTLELGVPNPYCPHGRTVRLANLVTLPEHRGHGFGTMLVRDVVEWARSIEADRVDLSATVQGQRLYEGLGFELTTAPRMKLVL